MNIFKFDNLTFQTSKRLLYYIFIQYRTYYYRYLLQRILQEYKQVILYNFFLGGGIYKQTCVLCILFYVFIISGPQIYIKNKLLYRQVHLFVSERINFRRNTFFGFTFKLFHLPIDINVQSKYPNLIKNISIHTHRKLQLIQRQTVSI